MHSQFKKGGVPHNAGAATRERTPAELIPWMTEKITDGVRRISQREYLTVTITRKDQDGNHVVAEQKKLKKLSAADLNAMCNASSALMALKDQYAAGEEVRALKEQLAEMQEVVAQLMQVRMG